MKPNYLIICLLSQIPLSGQAWKNITVEPTFYHGNLIRHTPKLSIQTGQTVPGQELNFRFQTDGSRDWHISQRFPVFGFSISHFDLGEGAHGHVFGFLPNLSVPIFRGKKWAAMFRLGTGLARVQKPYDYFSNPGQNAIGSRWNNFTQFRLGGEFRLNQHFRFSGGASLVHFSNGAAALPNFGTNIPAAFFSTSYSIENEPFMQKKQVDKKPEKRLGALIQVGTAYVEYSVFDGPRYPIRIFSAAALWHFNHVNRSLFGFDWERNHAVFAWGLQSTAFKNKAEARLGSTRFAPFVGHEFLFGWLGVQLQAGYYSGKRINRFVLSSYYSKLAVRGYFPRLFGTSLRPNVGIFLKAHKAVAEYISFNVGLAF